MSTIYNIRQAQWLHFCLINFFTIFTYNNRTKRALCNTPLRLPRSVARYIMTHRNFIKILLFVSTVLTTACGTIEEKAKKIGDKSKSKGKQLIETAINKVLPDEQPLNFSIRSIVKDFQNDKNITEIKGIQIDNNFLFVEYCVYIGQKNRVLSGVNKIVAKKVNNYTSDENCVSVTKDSFYENIAQNEKDTRTAFFWNFEKLKKYEIYTCTKAPLRHYIIFDKNSDTVYHRIEELRD